MGLLQVPMNNPYWTSTNSTTIKGNVLVFSNLYDLKHSVRNKGQRKKWLIVIENKQANKQSRVDIKNN